MQLPPLTRADARGAKRIHSRIENLTRLNVNSLVKNKPDARHTLIDKKDRKIQFDDRIVNGEPHLVVYVDGSPLCSFLLEEIPITGKLKQPMPFGASTFYVRDGDRRFRYLYLDEDRMLIAPRTRIGAVYTSTSIGDGQRKFWQEYRKAAKTKVWTTWPQ